jgi:hypothetical protein
MRALEYSWHRATDPKFALQLTKHQPASTRAKVRGSILPDGTLAEDTSHRPCTDYFLREFVRLANLVGNDTSHPSGRSWLRKGMSPDEALLLPVTVYCESNDRQSPAPPRAFENTRVFSRVSIPTGAVSLAIP